MNCWQFVESFASLANWEARANVLDVTLVIIIIVIPSDVGLNKKSTSPNHD